MSADAARIRARPRSTPAIQSRKTSPRGVATVGPSIRRPGALAEVVRLHELWLNGAPGGQCADLRGAELRGADLRNAKLRNADLQYADLRSANLRLAALRNADLQDADLRGADLWGADLKGATLTNATLDDATLHGVDLRDADLRGTDLRRTDLQYARLQGVKLQKAVLPNGRTYEQFLAAVPALLTAGGRPLADVATPEHWACHNWNDCPLHAAFGAICLQDVPAPWRATAQLFLTLFDNRLIPLSQVMP